MTSNGEDLAEGDKKGAKVFADAKHFIVRSLENGNIARHSSCTFWDFLSDDFKQDHDIVLAAFTYGHVKSEDLPAQWRHDRSFFLEAVGERPACWRNLAEEYQRDTEIVRNFPVFGDEYLVAKVFEKIPALRHDHEIWDTIISSKGFVRRVMRDLAPISVLNDRELMLKVCQNDFGGLLSVGDTLQLNRDFLQQAIDTRPLSLMYVTHEAQRRFPEILTDNLKKYFDEDRTGHMLVENIAEDFWTAPWFVKAWFTSGGTFQEGYFDESLKDDEQIFRWTAESHKWNSSGAFRCMSYRLKGDRPFVWEVMGHIPNAYWCASDEIQTDYRFQVKGLALSDCFASNYARRLRNQVAGQDRLQTTKASLQNEIELFETFMTTVLLGISLPADKSQCPLTLLNQGTETSIAYKRLIMEYVGVPTGIELWKVRQAHKHLRLAEQEIDERELREANEQVMNAMQPEVVDNRDTIQAMFDIPLW